MSEDHREAQSKSDRPAAMPGGASSARDPHEAQSKSDRPAAMPGAAPRPAAPPLPTATAARVLRGAPPSAPPPAVSAAPGEAPADSATNLEDEFDEAEFPLTLAERLRRLPPAPVLLTVGSICSLIFLALAMTSHTTPVAVLMSAGVVTGLIFGADAVIASVATWRATQDGEPGRALLLATVGGISTLISAGAFAAMLVLLLVLSS